MPYALLIDTSNAMEIKRAKDENLDTINRLIVDSRSVWNYPRAYFEGSLPFLHVRSDYLAEHLCFEIHVEQKLVGFFAITEKFGEKYLDHLWIAPDMLRQGVGRLACKFIDDLARKQGWREILTYPDPPAEGFYLRQGFHDTGIRLPSRYEGGPIFSVFKKNFDGHLSGEARGLSHITITVRELAPSVSFYRDVLDFRVLAERDGKSAYLRSADLWLALVVNTSKSVSPDDYSHIALFASGSNFDLLADKVKRANAETWQDNHSPGRSLYFKDPSGNKLEIHEGTWRERIGWLQQNHDPSVKLMK